jgi:hypothetical protein
LFDKINEEDFKHHGEWVKYSYDRFLMYPMLEMTPRTRIRYIRDVLVMYNTDNPLSVAKVHTNEQKKAKHIVQAKKPYKLLNKWGADEK